MRRQYEINHQSKTNYCVDNAERIVIHGKKYEQAASNVRERLDAIEAGEKLPPKRYVCMGCELLTETEIRSRNSSNL